MGFKKIEKTQSERQVNEYLNLYDDDRAKEFEQLFMKYRAYNGSYTGSKSKGLEAFRNIEPIEYKKMAKAIELYLTDSDIEKKNGIANFFKNKIYLDYMPKKCSIELNGAWVDGVYDNERFIRADGTKIHKMIRDVFRRYVSEGKVRFLIEPLKEVG